MEKRRRGPYAAVKSRYLKPKETVPVKTQKKKRISKRKSKPQRRSKLMRHLLEPLLPPLQETLLARALKRINRGMHKRSMVASSKSVVQQTNQPHVQHRIAKVVDARNGDSKPNTSVLVLIKDSSDTRRHKNEMRYAIETAQDGMKVDLNCYGNKKQRPKAARSVAAGSHSRRAGTGKSAVGGKAAGKTAAKTIEIPLSNHLPIIDFISTKEFENMNGNILEKQPLMRYL